jgi:CBS-domain-containing membrane protein
MKAQDIMTRDVATVRPDTSVRDTAALMMERHISGMPVIGDDGAIVGIVARIHWISGWFGSISSVS